ncbi:hypothetical protein B5566_02615 [Mycobacterium sp. MHSD3]|nr:hypothetical protein B5566_02615 [Mycobacterium sp. MHSD3]
MEFPISIKQLLGIDEAASGGEEPRTWLTGRAAARARRRGQGQHQPARSRCQRLTPAQRLEQRAARKVTQRQARRAATAVKAAA